MANKTYKDEEEKEWTIMVYCASDNELAPLMVSQLRGLKDAGPNPDVNVLAYFDPNERGVPTRLYCINKAPDYPGQSSVDSHVNDMLDDHLEVENIEASPGSAAESLKDALNRPDQIDANDALRIFLAFCREKYRAKHYALVLMGHGMIVANDAFLPDESPVSAITLNQLGSSLDGFGKKLELLALHSCSMSAIEVAYELKGKANYMMASEGLSFVGGWPYRQLMSNTFSFVKKSADQKAKAQQQHAPPDVRELIELLYKLSSRNGKDFMLAGYSQDLALINLHEDKFGPLTEAMKTLISELKAGLDDKTEVRKQLIQLAHLESQSYFNESYTDLYDFCLCLARNCRKAKNFKPLRTACKRVMRKLEQSDKPSNSDTRDKVFNRVVIHSKHFGSLYQHSHGLSIYFPWSKPLGNADDSVLKKYDKYKFTEEFKEPNSWLSFLNLYLAKTERKARNGVKGKAGFKAEFGGALSTLEPPHKTSGASGPGCTCPSIKNFQTEEITIKGKNRRVQKCAMSRDF